MFHVVDAVSYLEKDWIFLHKAAAEYVADGEFGGYQIIDRFAERTPILPRQVPHSAIRVSSRDRYTLCLDIRRHAQRREEFCYSLAGIGSTKHCHT